MILRGSHNAQQSTRFRHRWRRGVDDTPGTKRRTSMLLSPVPPAAAQPTPYVVTVNTVYCPTWATLTLPTGPLSPNTSYKFTITGTGLYACFVGVQQGAATFIPTIIDNNNYPPTVEWGSYYYPAVLKGSGSNPDTFSFYASYTVPQAQRRVTPAA